MPARIEAFNMGDFTGGLNLNPDEFQLAPNESPELLNVDISYRGGVTHRKGYEHWAGVWFGYDGKQVIDAHPWYGHPSGPRILGAVVDPATPSNSTVTQYQENSITPWVDDHGENNGDIWIEPRSAAEFDSKLFVAGDLSIVEFDGVNGATAWEAPMAAGDFNSDLDNPADNKLPAASVVAAWQGSLWAAHIYENTDGSARTHPTRLRWTHPNQPKDWHPDHYVDLGDDEGGAITALVPDGDRLLVFRERKIHAVVGAPPEAIQVFLISDTLGCAGPKKVERTEHGVYFWNEERGVYRLGKSSIDWIFEKLFPALLSGRMDGSDAAVNWGGDRLYVKVKYDTKDGGDTYRSWFVYDPSLGKHGAWTRHAFTATPQEIAAIPGDYDTVLDMPVSIWFTPPGERPKFLSVVGGDWAFRSDVDSSDADLIWSSVYGLATNKAKFRTAWIDLGEPGLLKRFRRADVIGNGLDQDQQLKFEVFTDFDSARRRRFSEIQLAYPQEGDQYGTAVFGSSTFSAPIEDRLNVVERTSPLGRARAVQLLFTDEADPAALPWAIDLIVVKYTPYRMRG